MVVRKVPPAYRRMVEMAIDKVMSLPSLGASCVWETLPNRGLLFLSNACIGSRRCPFLIKQNFPVFLAD